MLEEFLRDFTRWSDDRVAAKLGAMSRHIQQLVVGVFMALVMALVLAQEVLHRRCYVALNVYQNGGGFLKQQRSPHFGAHFQGTRPLVYPIEARVCPCCKTPVPGQALDRGDRSRTPWLSETKARPGLSCGGREMAYRLSM